MKIAIIGSGHIGAGLARAWAKRSHQVVFGARDPADPTLQTLASSIGAGADTVTIATGAAEVIVLAVPYNAIDDVLAATGGLEGKIVIDCSNAVEHGGLTYGHTTSAAEELQKKVPAAHVFKSFNAQGAENLGDPTYAGVAADNFYCGDDPRGKQLVRQLVEDVGFEAIDAGPLKNARLLEPLMLLWVASAKALGTRDLAFKLLRR